MPSYNVQAINIGSFDLGEADRVLTLFSAEKGLIKAVAKGARKPGTKMAGRSDILCVNQLLLAKGRTFEIITQAQTIETFSALRSNLAALSYGLYYAELAACFGQGLEEEAQEFFDFLIQSLKSLAGNLENPLESCMIFELQLLDFLGYRPELTFCISCRDALHEYNLSRFNIELGGVLCSACHQKSKVRQLRESDSSAGAWSEAPSGRRQESSDLAGSIHITPLVWKNLVLCSDGQGGSTHKNLPAAQEAAQRILQAYTEQRAGNRFKSLDLLKQLN